MEQSGRRILSLRGDIFTDVSSFITRDVFRYSSNDGLYFDGLMQERRNPIANALELRLSCTNPSSNLHTCCQIMLWSTVTVLRYVVFLWERQQLSQGTADFLKKSVVRLLFCLSLNRWTATWAKTFSRECRLSLLYKDAIGEETCVCEIYFLSWGT